MLTLSLLVSKDHLHAWHLACPSLRLAAHLQKVSVAVTWIAVKVEEQYGRVKLSDLVMVFNVLQQREMGQDVVLENPDSDRFKRVQAEIATQYELGIFKALGFICHVDPPHKVVVNVLGLLFVDVASFDGKPPQALLQVCSCAARPCPACAVSELRIFECVSLLFSQL